MLVVGTGLFVQRFRRGAKVNIGFDPAGVLTLMIQPPAGVYATPEQAAALYGRLMDAAKTVPGVIDAAFINHTPYSPASMITTLSIEGRARLHSSNQILYRPPSNSYLRTMKMSMASGRWFDDTDMRTRGGGFIINETMAKLYWPGTSALAQRI